MTCFRWASDDTGRTSGERRRCANHVTPSDAAGVTRRCVSMDDARRLTLDARRWQVCDVCDATQAMVWEKRNARITTQRAKRQARNATQASRRCSGATTSLTRRHGGAASPCDATRETQCAKSFSPQRNVGVATPPRRHGVVEASLRQHVVEELAADDDGEQ